MKTLIGLSLSLCAKDILEGKVNFEDVGEFVLGTKIDNAGSNEEVFQQYATTYWRDFPPRDSYKLMQKILKGASQPKLDGARSMCIGNGQWLEVDIPEVFACDNCNTVTDNKDEWKHRDISLCPTCYRSAKDSDRDYAFNLALDNFNWSTIFEHMTNLKWTWTEGTVPTIPEMQVMVRMLYRDCTRSIGDKMHSRCSSGGFVVDITDWESSSEVRISFPLDQSYQTF
jgi:hypothetical protein